jgi:molybdenum cofactor biosynthesis enzyme MoaA
MHQEDWTGRIFKTSIELDITLACNLRCLNCDRAIRQAPSDEHMSLEQLNRFVDESAGWKWELLKLIGAHNAH